MDEPTMLKKLEALTAKWGLLADCIDMLYKDTDPLPEVRAMRACISELQEVIDKKEEHET